MSKLIKIAAILAVAAIAIAAKQLTPAGVDLSADGRLAAASVAPMDMMIHVGPLPETKVDSHF